MAYLFPSDPWVKALKDIINNSAAYQEAAQKWEGDITFVVQKGPGLPEDHYLYMDLWHGECRSAKELAQADEEKAAFKITAPIATWREVLEGRLDPIRGITTRRLKLDGNLMKVLKAPKAAVELVNCARDVDTEWPA